MTAYTLRVSETNKQVLALLDLIRATEKITIEEQVSEFEQKTIDQAYLANEAIKNGDFISSKVLREKSKQW